MVYPVGIRATQKVWICFEDIYLTKCHVMKCCKAECWCGYQMSTRWPSFPSLCTRATDPTVGMLSGGVPGCAGYTTHPLLTEQSTKNRARLSCHRYMYYKILFCKFDQIELGSWMTLSVKIYLVNFRLSITSLEWLWAKLISKYLIISLTLKIIPFDQIPK